MVFYIMYIRFWTDKNNPLLMESMRDRKKNKPLVFSWIDYATNLPLVVLSRLVLTWINFNVFARWFSPLSHKYKRLHLVNRRQCLVTQCFIALHIGTVIYINSSFETLLIRLLFCFISFISCAFTEHNWSHNRRLWSSIDARSFWFFFSS